MEGRIESVDEPLVCRFGETLIRYAVDFGLKESNQRGRTRRTPCLMGRRPRIHHAESSETALPQHFPAKHFPYSALLVTNRNLAEDHPFRQLEHGHVHLLRERSKHLKRRYGIDVETFHEHALGLTDQIT
ncbi:hypothetical protein SZ00_03173 [Rhodococcus sp. AD45]|nr:hypothetical protein SZ00_03173 [Rhodococcus sp. AD45]